MASQKMDPGAGTITGADIHKETLGGAGNSDPVLIPASARRVSVGVSDIGGTARIEYTLDLPATVEAGTAEWVAWAAGDVSANAADALEGPVTAVRCVATTSACTWHVLVAP